VPPPEIVLGIRPEHVQLAGSEEHNDYTVQGRVVLSENLGMSELISVKVRGADNLTLRALIPSDNPWKGEQITLTLPHEHLHWFNTQTGERLPADTRQLSSERANLNSL
jgi:multiple sugar transport system ATP-binding protein